MEKHKSDDEIFSGNGPEYEVWNSLYSGLDLARMELDCLSEEARAALTKFGKQIFSQRSSLTVALDDNFAEISQQALNLPWFKFAADIEFAGEAVNRAAKALDRYVELRPILTRYKLSDRAAKCLEEAGRTFLFSFDAACIAFCSAALEHTLRDALDNAHIISKNELQRRQCTAFTLLAEATQAKFLSQSAEQAARDLIAKRNKVLHRGFDCIKDEALQAMTHLGIVLQELGRVSASDA